MAHPHHALVMAHLDIVPRLARKLRLTPRSSVWDDAIQAGRMGLLNAAERFNPERGTPFPAYAREFVLNEIKLALIAEPVVRPSWYSKAKGASAACVELDDVYAARRVPEALAPRDVEERVADGIDQRQRMRELDATVRELSPKQESAIQAVRSGASVSEYAQSQGMPVRTASLHFASGREELRALFAESGGFVEPPR